MDKISVVIPCYNEEKNLPFFYEELAVTSSKMSFIDMEFVFVDDGSTDNTFSIIKELKNTDNRVRYISFSRNFGKEAAIYAGLKESSGNYVALLDADLQDPPSLLETMMNTILDSEYDCVAAYRSDRMGESAIRSFCARQFYKLINKISDIKIVDGARDFRLMTRRMVDAILEVTEYNRFSKGIFAWVGFNTKWLPFDNHIRVAGRSKWSFLSLMFYSMDGIIAFSTRPLYIASAFGLLFCLIAFVMVCVIIFKTLVFGEKVQGYPSMMCFIFFIAGIQLFCIGILGQYLAKNYKESKRRPIYIVREEG